MPLASSAFEPSAQCTFNGQFSPISLLPSDVFFWFRVGALKKRFSSPAILVSLSSIDLPFSVPWVRCSISPGPCRMYLDRKRSSFKDWNNIFLDYCLLALQVSNNLCFQLPVRIVLHESFLVALMESSPTANASSQFSSFSFVPATIVTTTFADNTEGV